MRNYHHYRVDKKKKRIRILLAILLVALAIGICSAVAGKVIAKIDTTKKIEKNVAKDEKKVDKADAEKKEVVVEPPKPVEVDPKAYKKGTSHNNEATAWAYKTADVKKWILQPSTYTGTDKLVFLTFDDGPSKENSNTVMDVMKNYGVHGSFFIVGSSADQPYAKEILQREIAEGHSVGLHSYSHDYSFLYPHRVANANNIMLEIDKNIEAIRKSLGNDYSPTTFRYPGGHMSWKQLAEADAALEKRGIHNIDWNVLTGDAEAKGSRRDLQGALDNIKEDMQMYGNPKVVVILMHDVKKKSVDALPSIIEYYQSIGYKFGILD